MPDKKPTDEEIVKAFELCQLEDTTVCERCPFGKYYPCCDDVLAPAILDLINRLQAENERLTIRLRKAEHQLDDSMIMYNTIKAEAYKEFAERLKEKYGYYDWENKNIVYPDEEINNLLNELVDE